MTSRKRAALRRRDRQAGRKPTAERFAELNANRELPTGMSSKASKLPVWSPKVIEALRGVVADSGLVEPLELRLRTHPGPKSKLRIETMLMLMLLANWTKCSYVQMDICAVESWLSAEIAFELELCHAGGWSLAGYWALRGQLLRLEEALHDGWEVDGVTYDVDWFSKSLIAATVPPEIAAVIEAIAVDLTAFPAWAVCREFISQADAERAIRQAYINKLPDGAPVPRLDMTSPQAREIAAELGITLGPDGLVVRSLDPDARAGHRTATSKQTSQEFTGFDVATAAATRSTYWAGNPLEASVGPEIPAYILAVHTAPANTNPGPRSKMVTDWAREIGPNIIEVTADQGVTQKTETFVIPARKDRLELHMRVSDEEIPVQIGANRETALDIGGTFYHPWMPQHLQDLPSKPRTPQEEEQFNQLLLERNSWAYKRTHFYNDGRMRFICPFHAGKLIGKGLPKPKNVDPDALVAPIPDGATKCCEGAAILEPEELGRYHRTPQGTPAHQIINAFRNAAESPYGTMRDRGGFDAKSCRRFGLVPHALAAVLASAVHNIQITMNREMANNRPPRRKHAKPRKQQAKSLTSRGPASNDSNPAIDPAPNQEPASSTSAPPPYLPDSARQPFTIETPPRGPP